MAKDNKTDPIDPAAKAEKAEKPDKGAAHLSRSDYADALAAMQLELNDLARWLMHSGGRMVVVLEGRDTAGKGGVASAISETLNPRQCQVVALGKPGERERTQWYFQRHVERLPAAGEIVLFDRSWYNRAGVERVMGYCSEAEAQAFLVQVPAFEQMLVDDGILLAKYWLTVDQAQQEARFSDRLADPLKRWKLSEVDVQARKRYADYGTARDAMLAATHRPHSPWTLVDFNDQRRGRLTLIRHLLDRFQVGAALRKLPESKLHFAPLDGKPLTEQFSGPVRPIPSWPANGAGR
ncbi:MAG: polyphosphate kinase 2 [Leptothrix sp. (in: b-proteobacteria)]